MALTDVQICNLAIGRLGKHGSVSSLSAPTKEIERICAEWYDFSRETVLKKLMPNFSKKRSIISALSTTPDFGYGYEYLYPDDCLKLLGIGDVRDKLNNYAVENKEGVGKVIYVDEDYEDGLQIRYIKNVTNTADFTPEFINLLSWQMAYDICLGVTQSMDKLMYIEKILPKKLVESSALNAQESRPIRIVNSKFKRARYLYDPTFEVKL